MTYLVTIECYDAETVVALVQGCFQAPECDVLSIVNEREPTDDETADDIDMLMNQRVAAQSDDADKLETLERYVNDALGDNPNPDQLRGMIADIKGVQATMTHSNPRMRALDHLIAMLSGEIARLETDSDPTPPHGIERYWIDHRGPKTSGSGKLVVGLENVPCSSCGAPVGEICMAASHGGYRKGFGHSARRQAFKEWMGS